MKEDIERVKNCGTILFWFVGSWAVVIVVGKLLWALYRLLFGG